MTDAEINALLAQVLDLLAQDAAPSSALAAQRI
jgi:hypothetical protein